jgi:hypothetical protein
MSKPELSPLGKAIRDVHWYCETCNGDRPDCADVFHADVNRIITEAAKVADLSCGCEDKSHGAGHCRAAEIRVNILAALKEAQA